MKHLKEISNRNISLKFVTYGGETRSLINQEQETLRRFEKKIIRRVYGPVKEDDERRIRTNQEIEPT